MDIQSYVALFDYYLDVFGGVIGSGETPDDIPTLEHLRWMCQEGKIVQSIERAAMILGFVQCGFCDRGLLTMGEAGRHIEIFARASELAADKKNPPAPSQGTTR